MHLRDLSTIQPGCVLSKSIYTERGDVLLAEGTTLTAGYLDALRRRGFLVVYIEDGFSDDVKPVDLVSEQVRTSTAVHLARMFDIVSLTAGVTAGRVKPPTREGGEATFDLGDRPLNLPSQGISTLEALYRDVERIMNEILETNTVASLESLRTHSDYTFEHSVEVAIIAILLGRHLGLPIPQIRELAIGALLHDIGKISIEQAILNKPGKLTMQEFTQIKQHPSLGFELVRRLPLPSILPAHVAYQHHERQDGGGYPRGLIGNNRILRLETERLQPQRIVLIAEIAAVADVFCALASERPYKPAFALDRVRLMLTQIAGSHLNKDVVTALLRVVPMYAVGHWIEVTSGPYLGWRGVVTEVDVRALHAPGVRLHLDPRGEAVADPIELDLRQHEGTRLACIPPGQDPASRQVTRFPSRATDESELAAEEAETARTNVSLPS
jgi:putative nucleotidyltransferase with HDIG domain